MSALKGVSGPWYYERPIRTPNEEAMRQVAWEELSFPCLREFKKRLKKKAGWGAP